MNEYVICKRCGKKLKSINKAHLDTCGISREEYIEKYGSEEMISELLSYKVGSSFRGKKRLEHSKRMSGAGNPMFGKKRTKEEKELISRNRKGKGVGVAGKYERTAEIRERISDGVAQAYIDGKLGPIPNSCYEQGHIFSKKLNTRFHYRSSWEKFVLEYLEKHPNIEYYDVEPFRIKYFDPARNKMRNYVPDFLVEFDCGIKEIWEVKPSYLVEHDATTKAKMNALNKFLEENDKGIHNGFIITEKEIIMMKTYDFVDKSL